MLSRAYHLDCESEAPAYNTECCYFPEFGRVRSVAFIHKSYINTVRANPSDYQTWANGIVKGLILLVPRTTGTFEPGEPDKLKGYGRRQQTKGMRTLTLSFSDPSLLQNSNLYEYLRRSSKYIAAFRTASVIHIMDSVCDVVDKAPVEGTLDSIVDWDISVSTRSYNLPLMADCSSIRSLFNCVPPEVIDYNTGDYLITEDQTQVILAEDGTPILSY